MCVGAETSIASISATKTCDGAMRTARRVCDGAVPTYAPVASSSKLNKLVNIAILQNSPSLM